MHKLIIIGSGPAGLTAAIYAGRVNLDTLVFDGPCPGGPLTTAWIVENFPGFPEGVDGAELMRRMREQAEKFGAKFVAAEATAVDFKKKPFAVFSGETAYQAEAVIIATGTEALGLGLDSEKKLSGRGVSYCATCDGPLYKNKKVIVLGGGDTALKEVTFLSGIAKEVVVLQNLSHLTGSEIMQDRIKTLGNVRVFFNTEIEEFVGEKKLEKVKLVNNKTKEKSEMECDGVFVAIGRKPKTEIFDGQIEMELGFIVTEPNSTKTSVAGVFAAGDAVDRRFRQAVVAAGSGAMAAMEAEWYFSEEV
jgi:thioredoxin reductase (NADPH)